MDILHKKTHKLIKILKAKNNDLNINTGRLIIILFSFLAENKNFHQLANENFHFLYEEK